MDQLKEAEQTTQGGCCAAPGNPRISRPGRCRRHPSSSSLLRRDGGCSRARESAWTHVSTVRAAYLAALPLLRALRLRSKGLGSRLALVPLVCLATLKAAAAEPTHILLATVDAGHPIKENSPEARRALRALQAVGPLCIEEQRRVADMAVVVVRKLRGEALDSRPVDVVEGLATILAFADKPRECASTLAMYATVRHSGQTHSEAIAGLRALEATSRGLAAPDRPR